MIKRLFLVLLIVAGIVFVPFVIGITFFARWRVNPLYLYSIEIWICGLCVIAIVLAMSFGIVELVSRGVHFIRYGSLVLLLFFAMSGCKEKPLEKKQMFFPHMDTIRSIYKGNDTFPPHYWDGEIRTTTVKADTTF